jgi:hypothetical protein
MEYHTIERRANNITVAIYVTEEEVIPKYVDDRGCRKLGEFVVNIPNLHKYLFQISFNLALQIAFESLSVAFALISVSPKVNSTSTYRLSSVGFGRRIKPIFDSTIYDRSRVVNVDGNDRCKGVFEPFMTVNKSIKRQEMVLLVK